MALPLIGGIPWIAGILGSLFFSLIQFFTKFFGKRLALVAGAVVLIFGLTSALFVTLIGLIDAIAPLSPTGLNVALSWVVPDQTPLIISSILSAHIFRWVYEWNVKVIQWKLV